MPWLRNTRACCTGHGESITFARRDPRINHIRSELPPFITLFIDSLFKITKNVCHRHAYVRTLAGFSERIPSYKGMNQTCFS